MADRYYEITSQSKFHVKIDLVKNLEDVTGELLSEEEVCELKGEEYDPDRTYPISTYCPIINKDAVDTYLAERMATAKEKGTKTFTVNDEFMELITVTGKSMSDFIPNSRRVGKRVSFIEPKKPTLLAHYGRVRYAIEQTILKKYNFIAELFTPDKSKPSDDDIKNMMVLTKKLVTYDEVKAFADSKVVHLGTGYQTAVEETAVWWEDDVVGEEETATEETTG